MQGGRDCCDVMLPGANDLLANLCWGGFLGWFFFGWLWGRMETKDANRGPRFQSFCFAGCLSGKLFTGTSCEGRQHLPKPDRVFSCGESAWEKHDRRFYSPVWWSWTCIYYIHHMLRYGGVHYIGSQWDMRNCFPLGPVRLTLGWWGWRITKAPDWGGGRGGGQRQRQDVAEHAFVFSLKSSLEWFPLISTYFFLFACEFSTLPSRCMWCFCRRTKGLGFWALVGILDIPPPTEDHIHLISEIETQPKRRKPRWFEGIFLWETTRWPDIGQPLIWGDIFFSFLQPRIGTTARWSTHWSALDTSTTCPWIASPQNSVAEGIAWTGLRWKILSPTTPSGFSTSLCTIYPSRCRKSDESVKQRQQT